nr:Chain A, Thrombospondin-Related Sporozoite Protein (TRSP) [Plasmodium falciparum]
SDTRYNKDFINNKLLNEHAH